MLDDLRRNPPRLRLSIVRLIVTHALTGWIRRPKSFPFPLYVVFDDRAGHVENCLSRAIILFEANDARVRKVLFEIENVRDVGPSPSMDRLVFITDHANVLLLLR